MSTKYRFKELFGGVALAAVLSAGVANAESFSGFGQDIPLESAAKQIVPDGWSVDFGAGVDRKAAVSWSSAADWKSALSSAVARKGYTAQFGSSTVVIAKGGRVAQAPDAPKASPRKEGKPARAESPARRERVAKVAEEAPAKVGGGGFVMSTYKERKPAEDAKAEAKADGKWRPYAGKATKDGDAEAAPVGFAVAEGDDLRNVLETWGSANGWKVIWESQYNYPIAAAARFDGDFVQAATALVGAMSEARPAITVDFFTGNHVVVVSNKAADEAN